MKNARNIKVWQKHVKKATTHKDIAELLGEEEKEEEE